MADTPPRAVTLRDIAQRLGVNHSTVSLALRDSPQISPARRHQVQEAAREMGYRQNTFAALLGQQRHHAPRPVVGAALAWINCWPEPERLRGYREFELYWQGAWHAAERSGYRLEEFRRGAGMSAARLQGVLAARNVKGVLIAPMGRGQHEVAGMDWRELAAVRLGHSCRHPSVHVVTSDQLSNSLLAVENMRRLGYASIGYVTSSLVRTRFKAGFLMAQSELPPAPRVPMLVLATGEDDAEDLRRLDAWFGKYRPDAILTDVAAMRVMLAQIGREVPRDVGLAALSVLDGNADAGIDQNPEEIGKAAIEVLLSLLKHQHFGVPAIRREILIEGQWVDGATLPAR